MFKKTLLMFLLLFCQNQMVLAQIAGGGGEANPGLRTHAGSLKAWQAMRFGMFIHWGPVTLRGQEIGWSRGKQIPVAEYDSLYLEFNPVLFNADDWVQTARSAGMKYLIITSKHHDGFSLWDSDITDYDIASTPYGKDILKMLSAECRTQNILFGTYYSIADWRHPFYTTKHGDDPRVVDPSGMPRYVDYMKKQIRELVTDYKTRILWFDGEWEKSWNHQLGMDLYKYVRDLDAEILINNRVDSGRDGMKGMSGSSRFAGDFGTPEQRIGNYAPDTPWESCITLCKQWAWKPNDEMKSLKECIHTLIRTAGGGGNLLLNIAPMPDGRIEMRQKNRLAGMGEWLREFGGSIYDTKGGPYRPDDRIASTRRGNQIFLHILNWPASKKLQIRSFSESGIESIQTWNGQVVPWKNKGKHLHITLPENPENRYASVLMINLTGHSEKIISLKRK
ncbi:hypothetical protein BVY01_03055 [bacterium I07]|nr:hypothetical protein BVY01_03055 [bacterium I07]